MPLPDRRTFLKRAGATVGVGGTLAGGGFVAADRSATEPLSRVLASSQDGTTPLREPGAETNWVGYRSGPGHDGAVAEAPDVDPEEPGCTCFYRGEFHGEPAVDDDAMYLPSDGRVVVLDGREGTVQWTTDDFGVSGTPSVGYGRLFVTGDGTLRAFDLEDRSVDWEAPFDDGPSRVAVAHETVYVVGDGTLHALDVADGATRWEDDEETFLGYPAVTDGRVYALVENPDSAGDQDLLALDATSGETLWRSVERRYTNRNLVATDDEVSAGYGYASREFFDTESGEFLRDVSGYADPVHDGREVYAHTTDYELDVTVFDGDSWEFYGGSLALSKPAVAGDRLYAYLGKVRQDDLAPYEHSLLAFDKYDGTVEWSCETLAVDDGYVHVRVVATDRAVYVVGDEEIHAVHAGD